MRRRVRVPAPGPRARTVTVTALLDQHERGGTAAGIDDLDEAIEDRAELFQAQGMVMVQLGITIGEAMARMRAYAYAENRRLGEVARDIVARQLRFDPGSLMKVPTTTAARPGRLT
jgi:hypothetical protein